MGQHRSRSVGLVSVVLIAMVAMVLGGAAGLWLGYSPTPAGVAQPPPADTIHVVTAPFDDARPIRLTLDTHSGLTLVSHGEGVITQAQCQPGDLIDSGSLVWRIDNAPVMALFGQTPFFRDLALGDDGPDVIGLQQELLRLGFSVSESGMVDEATDTAVTKLLGDSGPDRVDDVVLPLSRLVWLPAESVVVASCAVVLGGPVAQGAPLAVTAPVVAGLSISSLPIDLLPGERVVTVGEVTVPLATDGHVNDQDAIDTILASDAGVVAVMTAASDDPVPLTGTLALVEPISAATIPATAVISGAGSQCVMDPAGEVHAVRVVDSSLGRSVVEFTGDIPDRVRIAAGGEAVCGS